MDSPGPQQIIFEVMCTPGPNFEFKKPMAPNSKIRNFPTKPNNMGVYELV